VQNSYSPKSERGSSVTDQRQRFVFSWIFEPRPLPRTNPWLEKIFNDWKASGLVTVGSGRPVNPTISGDANQDGNSTNDRLPGASRNSILGPDYATTDMRITRRLYFGDHIKLDLIIESFNLLNRDNKRVQITEDGLQSNTAKFVKLSKQLGINYFPGHYQRPSNPFRATSSYAPRQLQMALKMTF
jgi:hypothetical protein